MFRHAFGPVVSTSLSLLLMACAPTLDWREIRVDDGLVRTLFPCRPERQTRTITLEGSEVKMELSACTVEHTTYAASWLAVQDPSAVTAMLQALQAAAAANIGAAPSARAPVSIDGLTPNPAAGRLSLEGRLPDRSPVREHAVFVAKGLRVYQLAVIGTSPPAEGVSAFLGGLKVAK